MQKTFRGITFECHTNEETGAPNALICQLCAMELVQKEPLTACNTLDLLDGNIAPYQDCSAAGCIFFAKFNLTFPLETEVEIFPGTFAVIEQLFSNKKAIPA